MFLRFFKEETAVNLLSILILSLLLWFIPATSFSIVEAEAHSMLFRLGNDFFMQYAAFFSWLAFFLMIAQAFILYKLSQILNLFPSRMVLPLFIFVLLLNFSPALTNFNPYILGSFFFLWGSYSFFKAYEKEKAYQEIFNTGFLFALAAFCFTFYAVFFIAVLLGFVFFGMAKWRNFIIFIIGFLAPFLFGVSYYYLFDDTAVFFHYIYPEQKNLLLYLPRFNGLLSFVHLLFLLLFAIYGYFYVLAARSERSLLQLKTQSIVLYLLFFSVFITMLKGIPSAVVFIIMAPMLSIIFSLYIMQTKNTLLGNILFFILLLLSIFERLNLLL